MNSKDVNRHTFRLISVGRLIKVKGYERLIRVIGRLKKEGYMLTLTILGDGEFRNELEDLLKKEELQGVVTLAGFVENPYPYIRGAICLFVHRSARGGHLSYVKQLFWRRRCWLQSAEEQVKLWETVAVVSSATIPRKEFIPELRRF